MFYKNELRIMFICIIFIINEIVLEFFFLDSKRLLFVWFFFYNFVFFIRIFIWFGFRVLEYVLI